MDTCFPKLILDNESQEMWIQALKNHKSKGDIDESTLEDAQRLVPHEYWEDLDVFSKLMSSLGLLWVKVQMNPRSRG